MILYSVLCKWSPLEKPLLVPQNERWSFIMGTIQWKVILLVCLGVVLNMRWSLIRVVSQERDYLY